MENEGRSWRPLDVALLAALVAVALWTQRQQLLDILAIGWRDAEQSHIFLVPPVAAWLLWLRRTRIRAIRFRPSLLGPAVMVASAALSAWGLHAGVQVAWHAGAIGLILGVLLSMTGAEPLRQFGAVFCLLVFALPVPGMIRHGISLQLQPLATAVTQGTLETFGVESVRANNLLIVNGVRIAVGEACNGMRMVFALFLVVYAFAFGTPLRMSTRLVLLALSPVVALACNVIRLVPTSLIYGYGSPGGAELFHEASGWLMLPLALLLLVGVLRLLRWLELPVTSFRLASP